MNIEMPNKDERKRAISEIVDIALPQKTTLRGEVKRLYKTVGIKNAFCGVGDAVAAAIMISVILGTAASIFIIESINIANAGLNTGLNPQFALPFRYLPLILLAPVLYFSLLAFTSWKERMSGTWQVLSVCRYNLKFITAVRVIIVSLAGAVFLIAITLPLSVYPEYPRMLGFAFCAMFFYGSFTLLTLMISESKAKQGILPIIWFIVWTFLCLVAPRETEGFLSGIPITILIAVAVGLCALYLFEMRLFVLRSTRRVRVAA